MIIQLEIIKADTSHAQDMGHVHAKSWQKAYRGIASDDFAGAFTPQKRAEIFAQSISAKPDEDEYYLFKVDGRPAGIALLHKSREKSADGIDGEIYAIYFHPDFWGTGAAHKAFQFCVQRLKDWGCEKIIIWVLEKNTRARRFYEKHGFTSDGITQQVDLGVPLAGVRYSKKL